MPQIEVSFELDANGIVHVAAKDLGTGKKQSVKITAQSGLNEDEIKRMVGEAEQHKADDDSKKKQADVRNRAEGLIYSTERTLEEYGAGLDPTDKELIQHDLEQLKAALDKEGLPDVDKLYKALETSAYRIAETIYAQQATKSEAT